MTKLGTGESADELKKAWRNYKREGWRGIGGSEKRTEDGVDHEELHGGTYGGPDRGDLQVPARESHDMVRSKWILEGRGGYWLEGAEVTARRGGGGGDFEGAGDESLAEACNMGARPGPPRPNTITWDNLI